MGVKKYTLLHLFELIRYNKNADWKNDTTNIGVPSVIVIFPVVEVKISKPINSQKYRSLHYP
jgi:hypothetical protein